MQAKKDRENFFPVFLYHDLKESIIKTMAKIMERMLHIIKSEKAPILNKPISPPKAWKHADVIVAPLLFLPATPTIPPISIENARKKPALPLVSPLFSSVLYTPAAQD